jgi:CRISPR/Cas system-associated exonuclease Cas4 (RecB family)
MEPYIQIFKNGQQQSMSRESSISIKDLTLCHRKKVFSIVEPVPMTDEESFHRIFGQANHEVIQRYFMIYPERFRSEVEVQYEGVRGRIDIHDKILNNIIDIKVSKSQKILLKPFTFHEKQVRYYMAMMGSDEGQIIYEMNNFSSYRAFPIYMNEKERRRELEELRSEAQSLQKAIDASDPSLARSIYEDREINWMCNKCMWKQKCESMREKRED